jgi:hypothetical protein
MSEADTSPPGILLIAYVLSESHESLSVKQLQERVEEMTGRRPNKRTVQKCVQELREDGTIALAHDGRVRRYKWPTDA